MSDHQLISRKDAKAQGLKFYFTGKPCERGHVVERAVGNAGCIECRRLKSAEWYKNNTDAARAKAAAWYKANTERALFLAARWKVENKEQRDKANQAYYEANKPKIAAYKKAWKEKNFDKLKVFHVEYARANRERIRANFDRWAKANKDKIRAWTNAGRARRRGAEGKYTAADISALFARQRGRCAYCKASLKRGYHIDHIVPVVLGGSNWPANLQLACMQCNCSKGGKDPIVFAQQRGMLL